MRDFFIFFYEIFFESTDLLMICMFILFIDFNHRWWSFHKINSEIFKELEQILICVDNNSLTILNEEDIS